MLTRSLAASAIVAVASALDIPIGMTASMDIAIFEQAKDVYFQTITDAINNLQLPDFYEDKNHYITGNHFTLNQSANDVTIITDVQNNAIVMRCDNLSGTFYADDFRYKSLGIFIATGHIEVEIDTIMVQAGFKFETQETADGTRQIPKLTSVDVDTDIDRWDIDIKIYGNIWSDFASAFEVFFVGSVVDAIEDGITSALQTTAPDAINSIISATNGYLPMPVFAPNWKLDWETAVPLAVTNTYLGASVKGLFLDSRVGEEDPGVVVPVLPVHLSTQTQKFQAFMSTYSMDTLFSSFLEVGKLEYWFRAADVDPTSSMQLDTTELNIAFPGISDYYGAGVPCDLKTSVTSIYDLNVEADNELMGGYGTAQLEVWVNKADGTTEMAIQIEATKTNFEFNAAVADMDVSIQVDRINSAKIVVDSCTYADPSAYVIKLKVNNLARVALAYFNPWLLENPIVIPSNIGGIFELSDLFLGYYDDYVYVGATPTFIAPADFVSPFIQ